MRSDQARISTTPSIIDIVKDFMVAEGFDRTLIKCSEWGFAYDGWQLGGVSRGQFYMIPFKTNKHVPLNPTDPEFFNKLRKTLEFPESGSPFGNAWSHRRWRG